MLEKRFGKEYERVRKSGPGNLDRAGPNTTRYDFFFDAVNDRKTKSFAHAWRGRRAENAERELRAYYRRRGYELENMRVATIPESVK
jgi:hypothetical protein